jgi:hypothetical protein
MPLAALAGFACVLSAISTLAMWGAVRSGHVASISAIAGLGATGISGLLCVLLARQQRWFVITLLALAAVGCAFFAAYVFVESFRRWCDVLMGWAS